MAAGAAAKASGNNKIGFVAPYPIPECVREVDAFTMGAQLDGPARPRSRSSGRTPGSPRQPSGTAAESLVAAGVSVLGDGQDSPTTGQVAEAHGLKWTGYDSNQESFAPNAWLTATTYNWGPYYIQEVKAAMNGTWKSHFWYGSLADNFVVMAPFGKSVTQATRHSHHRQGAAIIKRHLRPVHRADLRPEWQDRRAEGRHPHRDAEVLDQLVRKGRHRQPEGLTDSMTDSVLDAGDGQAAPAAGSASASSPSASVPGAAPRALAVQAVEMTKRFPGVVANDHVSFEAAAGEVHALLGENGAGKTTLCNLLMGLYRPDEGKLFVDGKPVRFHSPRDAQDAGIFMVHQHLRLVESMTVAENVVLGWSDAAAAALLARDSREDGCRGRRTFPDARRPEGRGSGSCRSASASGSRS